MDNAEQINALLKRLDAQRDEYLESFRQVHELLAQNLAAAAGTTTAGAASPRPGKEGTTPPRSPAPSEQRSPRPSVSRPRSEREIRKTSTGLATLATLTTSSDSRRTGEDSDEDDDENLYASNVLEPQLYTEESLRKHLQSYRYNPYGAKILAGIIDSPARLLQSPLIPTRKGPLDDRSHLSHCQVYDVGQDGAPLQLDINRVEQETSRANAIWCAIKGMNQPPKEQLAVGRITILRELSPILFGAAHHVYDKYFDVNELFRHLVSSDGSSASMHRMFDEDIRKQRSFVFNLEYFTIIGKDCKPMKWQIADRQEGESSSHHIPVTRCSSVVALVLNGPAVRKVRNPHRLATNSHGFAYDPWSSWQVINLQAYPDWRASMDVHDSTKHYVNGVEAFLATLLGEFKDAQKRFEHIYEEITKLITPPLEFMFDSTIRDKLLFEDQDFTHARRYFWASQTLGLMNESIKQMIDAYEDTFTDEVWSGEHKTLWPLLEKESSRSLYYKKRMSGLRQKFEVEIKNLNKQMNENKQRRIEIAGLKDELFTGTSIQESRKSVENTEITIQQGHNIKLLTLVSIFFLPLTFVTSVFGMTNMPTEQHYWAFGIVTATVCVPFFLLIGSLNTTRGMHFWRNVVVAQFFAWLCGTRKKGKGSEGELDAEEQGARLRMSRSTSMQNSRDLRLRRWSTGQNGDVGRQSVEMKQVDPTDANGAAVRPTVALRQSSRLIEMLADERERKRTLRYSPNV